MRHASRSSREAHSAKYGVQRRVAQAATTPPRSNCSRPGGRNPLETSGRAGLPPGRGQCWARFNSPAGEFARAKDAREEWVGFSDTGHNAGANTTCCCTGVSTQGMAVIAKNLSSPIGPRVWPRTGGDASAHQCLMETRLLQQEVCPWHGSAPALGMLRSNRKDRPRSPQQASARLWPDTCGSQRSGAQRASREYCRRRTTNQRTNRPSHSPQGIRLPSFSARGG